MLNEYVNEKLLFSELLKRDWFLSSVEHDQKWLGGTYPIPFKGAQASSVKCGSLTADTDIADYDYVRGSISAYKEVWGSLQFHSTDLMQHGKISEQNFLRMLPDQLDQFSDHMKMIVSQNLLNGAHIATATSNGTVGGVIGVDKIDRFELGQKVTLDDADSGQGDYYVIAIDINAKELTLSATRGGAAADISAYTTAQSAKLYPDGVLVGGVVTNSFQSVRDALLSAANGGAASLHGQTKLAFPYLQATNIDGTAIDASNMLTKLFDAFTEHRTRARASMANKVVMSYKNLGSVMKLIETQKGPFKVSPGDTKASLFGWTTIDITSVKGTLQIVGLQEADDDVIMFLDMSAFKFLSNGGIKKHVDPDGNAFYPIRSTSGYKYVTDLCLQGELAVLKPSSCAIIHTVAY